MPALTSADLTRLATGAVPPTPQSSMVPGMAQAIIAHLASAQPGAMGTLSASQPAVNGSSPIALAGSPPSLDLSPLIAHAAAQSGGFPTPPPLPTPDARTPTDILAQQTSPSAASAQPGGLTPLDPNNPIEASSSRRTSN